MKKTIRENINSPYCLHDMNVIEFEVKEKNIKMKTQSGIVQALPPYEQVDGYVEFQKVEWDFSYVYLLNITKNEGDFIGKKMFLKDFINNYKTFGFSIMDECYGYNQTKYSGYITTNRTVCECIIEIYHKGDMIFVAEK